MPNVQTRPEQNNVVIADAQLQNRVQKLRLNNQLGQGGGRAGFGSRIAWLPWMLCLLLALAWAFVGIRSYRPAADDGNVPGIGARDTSSNTASDEPTRNVQLEVKGYLVPAQQIAVSPIDVSGRVIELHVVEGQFYNKGELLAQLDSTNYQAAVRESEAAVTSSKQRLISAEQTLNEITAILEAEKQQAQALLDESMATQERSQSEWNRINSINGVSAQERIQFKTDLEIANARVKKLQADQTILLKSRPVRIAAAEADVAAAKGDVAAAEARLAQSTWRLNNCTITAPIKGNVLSKGAEIGNLVNPLAFAATSGSICNMADLSDLEADLEIPERDISKIKEGQPCRIRADAYPKKIYEGYVDRIMPIANRAKSIVTVRVKVTLPPNEKPGTFLKPEMGAVVSFLADEKSDKQSPPPEQVVEKSVTE